MSNREELPQAQEPQAPAKVAVKQEVKVQKEERLSEKQKLSKAAELFEKEKAHLKQKYGEKPFKVVALRAGFYKQRRQKEGFKFTIDSIDDFGTWMKELP